MKNEWREKLKTAYPSADHLVDGNEQDSGFAVDKIRLTGGDEIKLQRSGVTAIVGPNNVGKSTLLRELREKLGQIGTFPHQDHKLIAAVEVCMRGDEKDLIAWLGSNSSFINQGPPAGFQKFRTQILDPRTVAATWTAGAPELGDLAEALIFYGDAQGRFAIGGAVEMRESIGDPPLHPVHYLQDSKQVFREVSEIVQKIFGVALTLDTLARIVRIRVGEIDLPVPAVGEINSEYAESMASLRPLDEQGDGMRSMLGQLLPIVAAAYKVVILDEPEAFLHPPQAYALGVELGRLAFDQNMQILLATHDRNLLAGLLNSAAKVSVVRLSRPQGNHTRANSLDSEQLQTIWSDPVLKYTNVLDGLFHRFVVVAEAEGDCAYLAAAVDAQEDDKLSIPKNEILFVPTGGKDGMPKVCAALTRVGVPVAAAPDLDMLSNKDSLKRLVESLDQQWDQELDSLWGKATANLTAPRGEVKVESVLDAIVEILESDRAEIYSANHKKKVLTQLRSNESPWQGVKDHGLTEFKGEARVAVNELIERLDKFGVVLVKVGELERLAPEVSARKGVGWLQKALEAGAQRNPETQDHIKRILTSGETGDRWRL